MTWRRRLFVFLWLLELALFWAPPRAAAQSQTTVTGNVVDPKGFFYAGGSVKATLFPPGVASPCVFTGPNCVPIPGTVGTVPIDFFGNFTINLYPNNLIFCNQGPCTTQWTFQICIQPGVIEPPIGTGDQCFSVTTTIAGASQSITAQITAAPPPQLTRIPIGGGGGCTPSGVDTGILSEHPVGTCFDSLHATWDDGASKQNLQFGDGTNTTTGAELSFMLATGGKVNACFECWNFGQSNNLTSFAILNDQKKSAMGWFNTNSGAGSSEQFGDTNTLNFAGASHCNGCNDDLIQIGFENNMSSSVALSYAAPSIGHQFGNQNQATTNTAGGTLTDFVESGTANNFAETAGTNPGIAHAFAYGLQNRVKDDLGPSEIFFEGLYGFDNEADAIDPQDVSIFGASNTVHSLVLCSVGSCPPAQDSVVYGDQNTVTNAGGVLLAAVHSSVTNCTACGAFGYNEANSTNNSLFIGMGNHEIEITSNLVTMPSLASASVSPVCASTAGGLEIAGCPSPGGVGTIYTAAYGDFGAAASTTNFGIISGLVTGSLAGPGNLLTQAQLLSVACTAQNPMVVTDTAQPATGTYVFTLFDATTSSATAVTITIPISSAAGTFNGTGSVTLTAGHRYIWRAVNNATSAGAQLGSISFQCK